MKLIFVFLLTFLLYSCSDDDKIEPSTEVNIRLSNVSSFDFENTTYNRINFGDIKSGEKTEYKMFESAYGYGSVSITINGIDYGWIPIDFVGEDNLESGNYTFEYSFDSSTETLADKLIRD